MNLSSRDAHFVLSFFFSLFEEALSVPLAAYDEDEIFGVCSPEAIVSSRSFRRESFETQSDEFQLSSRINYSGLEIWTICVLS